MKMKESEEERKSHTQRNKEKGRRIDFDKECSFGNSSASKITKMRLNL